MPETIKALKRTARNQTTTLVCGYGNPGRRDDGLGPALVAGLESRPGRKERTDLRTEARLQLNIEDSLTVSAFERIIFVDASKRGKAPFEFKKIRPRIRLAFSTHALSPQSVLALCRELYDRTPQAFLLAVRGYVWDLEEGLSPKAEANLAKALNFLARRLRFGQKIDNGRMLKYIGAIIIYFLSYS